VAQEGKILDTLLFYTSNFISVFPRIVTAQIMMLSSRSSISHPLGTAQAA